MTPDESGYLKWTSSKADVSAASSRGTSPALRSRCPVTPMTSDKDALGSKTDVRATRCLTAAYFGETAGAAGFAFTSVLGFDLASAASGLAGVGFPLVSVAPAFVCAGF